MPESGSDSPFGPDETHLHVPPAPTFPPLAERWADGSLHDFRCQGDCMVCWGADACGLVGHSCIPCGGCADVTGAVLGPVGKVDRVPIP